MQEIQVIISFMDLFELVKSKRSDILNLAGKYGANNVRIFGSVARGTSNDQSDIDFLVDFNADASLLDWSGFWLDLSDLLERDVDVATEKSLKARYREKVLAEALPL